MTALTANHTTRVTNRAILMARRMAILIAVIKPALTAPTITGGRLLMNTKTVMKKATRMATMIMPNPMTNSLPV